MLEAIRNRKDREQGFTLIELMVVVLIIAILVAIAIPTFLGARERAQDKAAQSSLRNALTSAKVIYTDNESYLDATTTALADVEPSLTFVSGATASTTEKTVSVNQDAAGVIYMSALSDSGTCFFIKDNVAGPGTTYASSTATCSGNQGETDGVTGASW